MVGRGGSVLGPRMALQSRAARREGQLVRARGERVAALAGPRLRRAQFGGFLRCVFSPVLFGLPLFTPSLGGDRWPPRPHADHAGDPDASASVLVRPDAARALALDALCVHTYVYIYIYMYRYIYI